MRWYRVAAEKGLVRAMYNIAGMFKRGEGSDTDNSSAFAWYKLANDHVPVDPLKWPLEVRALFELAYEPCLLAKNMTAAESAKAEVIYSELSAKMKSPVPPHERFTSTREFRELCEK
jgi:hypothetical protein